MDNPQLKISLSSFKDGFEIELAGGSKVTIPATLRGLAALEHLLRLQTLPKTPISGKIGSAEAPLQSEIDKWLVTHIPTKLAPVGKRPAPSFLSLTDLGL